MTVKQLRHGDAPAASLQAHGTARFTTNPEGEADRNPTPVSATQLAAWDRLWARLLRPVNTESYREETAA